MLFENWHWNYVVILSWRWFMSNQMEPCQPAESFWRWGMRRWGSDEGCEVWSVLSRIVFNDVSVWTVFCCFLLRAEATQRHFFPYTCNGQGSIYFKIQFVSPYLAMVIIPILRFLVSKQPPVTEKGFVLIRLTRIIFHWQVRWPTAPSSTLWTWSVDLGEPQIRNSRCWPPDCLEVVCSFKTTKQKTWKVKTQWISSTFLPKPPWFFLVFPMFFWFVKTGWS